MANELKVTVDRVHVLDKPIGNIKGFARVTVGPFSLDRYRIIDTGSEKGPFAAPPQQQSKKDKTKYFDHPYRVTDANLRKSIGDAIIEAYLAAVKK